MSDRKIELETISALLREQSTLALATTDETGEPWVTPLYYIVDEELTLFWLSSKASLHSINLSKLSRAAVTVYRHSESWRDIQGVQMRGSASRIDDPKRRREVIKTYCLRFKLGTIFNLVISRCDLFAFRPEFIRMIDNSKVFGNKKELRRGELGKWIAFDA